MSATPDGIDAQRDTHFMELALRQAETARLLGAGRVGEAGGVGDFMRDRALKTIVAFPWAQARARTAVERSP